MFVKHATFKFSNPLRIHQTFWLNMLDLCYRVFLNCIFYLLQLFGFFLPVEFIDFTLRENKFSIFKQAYATFIALWFVVGYTYFLWLAKDTVFKVLRTSNIILLISSLTSFIFICLLSVLGIGFWNKENLSHYLKLQRILKSKMKAKLKRNKLYFCLECVFGHIALLVVLGIGQWRAYLFDIDFLTKILFLILKDLLLYYIFLITLIIYNSILLLRNHFNSLNIFLTTTVGLENREGIFTLYKPLEDIDPFPIAVISDRTLYALTEASKILSILFECVDIFNKIFGFVIMLITLSTVLTILTALNSLLVSAEMSQLTIEIILDCIFEALIFLVWNSSILSASGLLKEESLEIVKLCCKLQHLLPQSSQERKELLNLAHQVKRKSPIVSASGFFDVDFYLILAVFTYVGTYIVVLIQFSHMDF